MKKNRIFLIASCFIAIALANLSSCKKDDNTDDPIVPVVTATTTSISGIVVDINNIPIQGVTVKLEGSTIAPKTTSQYGSFYFHNVATSSRISLTFSKTNYLKVTRAEARPSNGVVIIQAMLIPKNSSISTTSTVNGTTGGNISLPSFNSKVTFPANSLVDDSGNPFTGNAEVSIAYLDPSADNFSQLIPGGDMLAINTTNINGILYSFGILKVEIIDGSGNALQLKNEASANATIEVGVPNSMIGSAPSTIPLWHFDKTKGKWIEEGEATLTGNKYVGQVSHFTDWNCDVWSETQGTITGTITDASGSPIAGVSIKIGQAWSVTNNLGKFTRNVPSGVSLNVSINNYFGYNETKIAGVLSAGQTVTVDFVLPQMNIVRGKLLNCSQTLVPGTVGISCGSSLENSSMITTTNGYFSIPISTSATGLYLWAYNGTSYLSQYIYPNFENNLDTIDDVFLCDIVTGPNQFTIDGAGFNNQTFSDFNVTKTAQYSEFNEMGQVYKNTNITLGGADGNITLSFNDNVAGTYTNSSNTWLSMYNIGPNSANLTLTTFSITVLQYRSVGQLVEGTYSGSGTLNSEDFTITNGKFSVIRIPNVYYNQGFKKLMNQRKFKSPKR